MFVTRSGLTARYGAQQARPMAAVALLTDNVPAHLRHVAGIDGRDPSYCQRIERVLISTHPDSPG